MFPYMFFLILIFVFLELGKRRFIKGVNFNFLAYLCVFIFSAIRFDVGYDYTLYYGWIEGTYKFIEDQLNRLEFLSRLMIEFSHDVQFFQLFFILSSFLIVLLFYKSISMYSLDLRLSTLIFICFPVFYFYSFSIIRQYIAIALIFYGYRFIKERALIKYVLTLLIAMLFHKSAVIAIPIYFFYGNFLLKKRLLVFLYVLGFFGSELITFFVKLLSERYSIYLGVIAGEGGSLMLIFFQILAVFIFLIIFEMKDLNDKDFNFYLLCFFIGLFIWSTLSKHGHAGFRGSLYFISFTILLIPDLISKLRQRKFITQCTIFLCFVFYGFNLYVGSKHKIKDPNMPYQTFFYKTKKDLKPNEKK